MAKAILFLWLVALFVCIGTADIGDECIVDDPLNNGTYSPHPTDCNRFLQCTHGYFYEKFCPEGLHWSVEDTACQWPEKANCEQKITDDPTGTEDVTWQPTIPTVDCAPTCTTLSFPSSTDDSTVSYSGTEDDVVTTYPDETWQPTSPTVSCAPTCTTPSFSQSTDDSTVSYPGTDDDVITT